MEKKNTILMFAEDVQQDYSSITAQILGELLK